MLQNVIKNAFKLNDTYTVLVNKISKKIVSKSKFSHIIAEELADMKLKFSKKNATRWNSVLFMVRSVLKATPQQLQYIQSQMPSNNQKAKQARREFQISSTERVMLLELKELLELFEIATNELQSNEVSISRVFPSINSLIINLSRNINDYTHTKEMRNVTYF